MQGSSSSGFAYYSNMVIMSSARRSKNDGWPWLQIRVCCPTVVSERDMESEAEVPIRCGFLEMHPSRTHFCSLRSDRTIRTKELFFTDAMCVKLPFGDKAHNLRQDGYRVILTRTSAPIISQCPEGLIPVYDVVLCRTVGCARAVATVAWARA